MTDHQYIAHLWLSRMWGKEDLITSKIEQRDKLIGWGVGTYDANHIPSGSDQNTSENKFIEYSVLSGEIDKSIQEYLREMRRTEDVIEKAKNSFQSALLYAWYINKKKVPELCKKFNYDRSTIYDKRQEALDAVFPYVPKDEVIIE